MGNPLSDTLAQSQTPPGNSLIYINPHNPADHIVSIGDWVVSYPQAANSLAIADALEALKHSYFRVVVPVWDQATGQGINLRYHISGFAWIYAIESYSLDQPNRLSFRYWGPATCPDSP